MSKGFKGFLVGLVTLISIFLGTLVGLSIKNKQSPADEIKSWFTTEVEASEETNENDDLEYSVPEGEVPTITEE